MKVKVRVRSVMDGKIYDAEFTTEHAASSYGQPVLVIDGQAVDSCWYEVVNDEKET